MKIRGTLQRQKPDRDTMIRTVVLIVLGAYADLQAGESPREALRLSGAFIQYDGSSRGVDWRNTLESMVAAGMNTVVVQYLKFGNHDFIRTENDPTKRILDLADEHNRGAAENRHMRVFIGLSNAGGWHGGRAASMDAMRKRLADAKADCAAVAARIKQLYGDHASFVGWYIPYEADNCYDPADADRLDAVHDFYKEVAQNCKRLLDKPVAMSVFFNNDKGFYSAEATARAYARILPDSGIRYLLLQDGVGERKWDDQIKPKIGPFFAAFGKLCQSSGIELWGVAECFRFNAVGNQRVPLADAARLALQLRVLQEADVMTAVAFEFPHYLDPNRHAADDEARLAQRKHVYADYRRIVGESQ
jgi:hypothetical protein